MSRLCVTLERDNWVLFRRIVRLMVAMYWNTMYNEVTTKLLEVSARENFKYFATANKIRYNNISEECYRICIMDGLQVKAIHIFEYQSLNFLLMLAYNLVIHDLVQSKL